MWPFRKYKIQLLHGSLDHHFFYVWNGCNISASGYGFNSAQEAANAAVKARNDLLEAERIIKRG